jgi:hypothetical protein
MTTRSLLWHWMEMSEQLNAPTDLPSAKKTPLIRWVGGWMVPRAWLCRESNTILLCSFFLTIYFSLCLLSFLCFLTEHHAMKAYWENGGIAPRILDPGTRWRWVVSFMLRPLYSQGKSSWYPLDRRLGAVLDAVMKRRIPSPRRESNPRTPIAQSYADWAITALLLSLTLFTSHRSILFCPSRITHDPPRN